jgi:predicted nucleic acid-binding Zn ribbon protein
VTDTPTASGVDLARQALAAARAAAKTRPAGPTRNTRRTTQPGRGRGTDPMGLGQVLERLKDQQGWESGINGGNLLEQWPTLCPTELATTVQPVGYDPDHGLLTLRPSSNAYATQIRLFERKLVLHLNERLGRPAVRKIRVLPAGATTTPTAAPERAAPEPAAPVRTRETASPGYRATLEAALSHRSECQPAGPYVADAAARQEAALRANREPETAFTDAVAEAESITAPRLRPSEVSRRAALAYKRNETSSGPAPARRAFDVA